jgi:hypothetical protein
MGPRSLLARVLRAAGSLAMVTAAACSPSSADEAGSADDAVTAIDMTPVKEQLVGTCWLYATAAWAEALHLEATRETINLSESYWTYWAFYDRIVRGEVDATGWVEEKGSWGAAAEIIARYGMMNESDFIPEEAESPSSDRTVDAFNAILVSLSAGALSTPASRRDRALVRSELDAAFGLRAETIAQLDETFGKDGRKVFTASGTIVPSGVPILRARDFVVAGSAAGATRTLDDYVGRDLPETNADRRSGMAVWKQVLYPAANSTDAAKRAVLRRVQKSLHDGLPVIVSWRVDHAAVTAEGALRRPSAARAQTESHLSLITDYQASNVPGFGVLPVGAQETRPEALQAALSDEAIVDLLRIKNSWGARERQASAIPPGYHDIHRDYYNASFERCDGATCTNDRALAYVILPSGY